MITGYIVGSVIFTIIALSTIIASGLAMEESRSASERQENAKGLLAGLVMLFGAWAWPVLLIPALIWAMIKAYKIAYPKEDR